MIRIRSEFLKQQQQNYERRYSHAMLYQEGVNRDLWQYKSE